MRRRKIESTPEAVASEEVIETPAEAVVEEETPPQETEHHAPSHHGHRSRHERGNVMNLKDLKEMKIADLIELAKEFNVEGGAGMRRQELIFALLNAQTDKSGQIFGEGILEILP